MMVERTSEDVSAPVAPVGAVSAASVIEMSEPPGGGAPVRRSSAVWVAVEDSSGVSSESGDAPVESAAIAEPMVFFCAARLWGDTCQALGVLSVEGLAAPPARFGGGASCGGCDFVVEVSSSDVDGFGEGEVAAVRGEDFGGAVAYVDVEGGEVFVAGSSCDGVEGVDECDVFAVDADGFEFGCFDCSHVVHDDVMGDGGADDFGALVFVADDLADFHAAEDHVVWVDLERGSKLFAGEVVE